MKRTKRRGWGGGVDAENGSPSQPGKHAIALPSPHQRLPLSLLSQQRNLSSERVAGYKGRVQNVCTSQSLQFCLNKHIDWVWPCYIFSLLFEKVHLSVVNWTSGTELSMKTSQGISSVQSFWILKGIFNMSLLSILCQSPTRDVKCRWGWSKGAHGGGLAHPVEGAGHGWRVWTSPGRTELWGERPSLWSSTHRP